MPEGRPTFRLYVLGRLEDKTSPQTLTMLADFKERRVVTRVQVVPTTVSALMHRIANLRGFIECGYPGFEARELQQLGKGLFQFIIQDKVKTLLDGAVGNDMQFRPFELFVEDFEIAGWPWEFLYDDERKKFLCQGFYPISRGIFTLNPGGPVNRQGGKLRLLVVLGVPPEDEQTAPQEELKWIKGVFRTSPLNMGKRSL